MLRMMQAAVSVELSKAGWFLLEEIQGVNRGQIGYLGVRWFSYLARLSC